MTLHFYLSGNNNTMITNNNKQNNNITINNNFNLNNISMCSTEISFSINRKYENLDELTDYKYSKTPKLRRKIKSILKDYDPTDSDYEYNKYKTNKLGVKNPDRSYYSFLNTLKKNDIQKTTSSDLFKRNVGLWKVENGKWRWILYDLDYLPRLARIHNRLKTILEKSECDSKYFKPKDKSKIRK